jgi:hypothetical protein
MGETVLNRIALVMDRYIKAEENFLAALKKLSHFFKINWGISP